MSKATLLKDAERSLAIRVRRIYTETPKGGPKGTSVELDGAQKDLDRAQARLDRAKAAHDATMEEAKEYAEIIQLLGGTVDFDSFMPKADPDAVDGEGNPTDPEREPEPNNGDDEDDDKMPPDAVEATENGASTKPARIGGRFAKRGTQV